MPHRRIADGLFGALIAMSLAARCAASPPSTGEADKGGFTLFNPTPRALMREMSTDRPDVTESPITVDAGHVQLEVSFVEYTYNSDAEGPRESWAFAPFNLKVGLTNNADLQLVVNPFLRGASRTTNPGSSQGLDASTSRRANGFGDAELRLKVNLLNNDPPPGEVNGWGDVVPRIAFGVMPFVRFPTATEGLGAGKVEGGLIFPVEAPLPGGFDLTTMLELDYVRDDDGRGYGVQLLHTASLEHEIAKDLSAYIEYVGVASHDGGRPYLPSVGTGVLWQINEDVQLDVAVNFGLSRNADDVNVIAGISVRL